MKTGTVKLYDSQKGFGFISVDGEEQDIFVHITEVEGEDELYVGEEVQFETKASSRDGQKDIACKVVKIGGEILKW